MSKVKELLSTVTGTIGETVAFVSSGPPGELLHNITSEIQRFISSPPMEVNAVEGLNENLLNQHLAATPNSQKNLFEVAEENLVYNCLQDSLAEDDSSIDFDRLSEDYFSRPEFYEVGSSASVEDLEIAIEDCKAHILNSLEATARRRSLVHQLIQLRLTLERAKEETEVKNLGILVLQGHQLAPLLSPVRQQSKQFCDKCTRLIWNVVHVMYKCTLCSYICHGKCIKSRHRKCPQLKFNENPSCILDICPQVGLTAQNFRCAECHMPITSKNVWEEPRLCDYTGKYFCPFCHWNCRMILPARVIHNWDFEWQKISQEAKLYLTFVYDKPIFHLEKLNPNLLKFVEELNVVKKLREDVILMKTYLRSCKLAQEEHLLRSLEERQHFVESPDFYSLKDLVDLHIGTLIPFLETVQTKFVTHIKISCEVCKGKGFFCELCSSDEVIFPFDENVTVCVKCLATFHNTCFSLPGATCRRCLRHSRRRKSRDEDDLCF